jgi:peptidoglycan/LPS O-acetylase OafA/YrhL
VGLCWYFGCLFLVRIAFVMTRLSPAINPGSSSQKFTHLAGLDGLRAVAVLAVIFYHLNLNGFFPGGFLGVDIFFTLSGFLITSLLLREHEAGGVSLSSFYLRRFRRLAPAMLGVIAVCALLVPSLAGDATKQLGKDIPAALFYYSNWWQIVSEQSYFEMTNRPPLLQHLWSLAIEEQFYLLWPLLFLVAVSYAGRRGLILLAASLTLLTAGWMAFLAVQGNIPLEADPNRLYLGTDTHTSGLFAGTLLACLWNPWRLDAWLSTRLRSPRFASALGTAGLVALMALFVWANETQDWLYRGGFLLVAVATAAAIIGATAPGSLLGRVLGVPVMRYLGDRSYGLYLWHWPVFVLLRPQDFAVPLAVTELLRLAITFLAAELSFRYIEDPFRQGSLLAWSRPRQALLLLVACIGVSAVTGLYSQGASSALALIPDKRVLVNPVVLPGTSAISSCASNNCPDAEPVQEESFSGAVAGPVDMLAIGDSVMLGARHYLLRGLPGVWVDAQVGRQGRDAIQIVRKLRAQGKLPATVVIHLGTNGYLPASSFRQLVAELADRERVVLVNVHASRRWASDNNNLLAEFGHGQSGNLVLVDWSTLSEDRPEYFVADGIHLSSKGIHAYVSAIRQACGVTGAFLTKAQVAHMVPAGVVTLAEAGTPASIPVMPSVASVDDSAPEQADEAAPSTEATNHVLPAGGQLVSDEMPHSKTGDDESAEAMKAKTGLEAVKPAAEVDMTTPTEP